MWLIIVAILSFGFSRPIYAQTQATDSATIPTATASATLEPTATVTPIPISTPHPAIALFNQYKNDYLFNRDQYQKAYLDYTQKKQIHTKYNTITTQKDKIEATKVASITRNNTLKDYMRALRVMLDIYKDTDPTNTSKVQIELSKLESWLDEQNSVVSSIINDDDMKTNAKEFKTKYYFVQQIIYTALTQNEFNIRLKTLNQLKDYISQLQQDPTINDDGKQWLNTLVIKADNSLTNLNAGLALATQYKSSTKEFSNFYSKALASFIKSNQYNQEIINNIRNILIKFIK